MDEEQEEKLKKKLCRRLSNLIGELEEINDRFSLDLYTAKSETEGIPFFLPFLRDEKKEVEHRFESILMDVDDVIISLKDIQERLSNDIIDTIDDYEPSYEFELMDEFELHEALERIAKKLSSIAKGLSLLNDYQMDADELETCANSIAVLL